MAQLIIRYLDDELLRALKFRAAQHGGSAETEYSAILHAVLGNQPNIDTDEDFQHKHIV